MNAPASVAKGMAGASARGAPHPASRGEESAARPTVYTRNELIQPIVISRYIRRADGAPNGRARRKG